MKKINRYYWKSINIQMAMDWLHGKINGLQMDTRFMKKKERPIDEWN